MRQRRARPPCIRRTLAGGRAAVATRRRPDHHQGQYPSSKECRLPGAAACYAAFHPRRRRTGGRPAAAAGAVIVGKTNVPEFTAAGLHRQSLVRRHPQPSRAGRTPGGSTGGGAAPSRPVSGRSPSAPMAAARSAGPPRIAVYSVSSRRSARSPATADSRRSWPISR